jgi:hypothetical protein
MALHVYRPHRSLPRLLPSPRVGALPQSHGALQFQDGTTDYSPTAWSAPWPGRHESSLVDTESISHSQAVAKALLDEYFYDTGRVRRHRSERRLLLVRTSSSQHRRNPAVLGAAGTSRGASVLGRGRRLAAEPAVPRAQRSERQPSVVGLTRRGPPAAAKYAPSANHTQQVQGSACAPPK